MLTSLLLHKINMSEVKYIKWNIATCLMFYYHTVQCNTTQSVICQVLLYNLSRSTDKLWEWVSQVLVSVRVAELKKKRSLRKAGGRPTAGGFTCVTCGRICASRIGLYSHCRTHPHHPWPEIRRLAGSVHHHHCQLWFEGEVVDRSMLLDQNR